MNSTLSYIAIDVAKNSLQLCSLSHNKDFSYDKTGLAALLRVIAAHHNPLVVFEASGGYERPLMCLLHEHNIPCNRLNPARVKALARSEGLKAKTDPIDARLILRFAQQKQLAPAVPPSAQQQALAAFLDRRSQLSEELTREKNRLQNSPPAIHSPIQQHILYLEEQLKALAQSIRALVVADSTLHAQIQAMCTVCGVGETTA